VEVDKKPVYLNITISLIVGRKEVSNRPREIGWGGGGRGRRPREADLHSEVRKGSGVQWGKKKKNELAHGARSVREKKKSAELQSNPASYPCQE